MWLRCLRTLTEENLDNLVLGCTVFLKDDNVFVTSGLIGLLKE